MKNKDDAINTKSRPNIQTGTFLNQMQEMSKSYLNLIHIL